MNRVFVGLIILIALTFSKEDRISDYRLCGDPKCSEPVSLAKSQVRYRSDDVRILSFENGVPVVIYSKSAGSKPDLWGAKINGKRGYIPKGLVREYKILKKSLSFTVPTEYNVAAKLTDDKEIATESVENKETATSSTENKEIAANSTHIEEIALNTTVDKEIAASSAEEKEIVPNSTEDNEIPENSIKNKEVPSKTSKSVEDKEIPENAIKNDEIPSKSIGSEVISKPVEDKGATVKSIDDKRISRKSAEKNEITGMSAERKEIAASSTEDKAIATRSAEDKEIAAISTDNKEIALNTTVDKDIFTKLVEDEKTAVISTEDKEITSKSAEDKEISTKLVEDDNIAVSSTEDKEIVLESTQDTKNETGKETSDNDSYMSASQAITRSITPGLVNRIPSASPNFGSFSFKGVSAEPSENKSPTPDTVVKPYDVIDGTTLFYSTDGEPEDGSASVVKATAVLHDTIPSATVRSIPSLNPEGNQDSSHEDPNVSEEIEESVESSFIKSEAENLINGKDVHGNGDQVTKEGVVKTSGEEENEDIYVSDEEGDNTDDYEEDDDDDDSGDDDGESGEDHSESNDESKDEGSDTSGVVNNETYPETTVNKDYNTTVDFSLENSSFNESESDNAKHEDDSISISTFSKEQLDINQTLVPSGEVSLDELSTQEEAAPGAVTELPVNEVEVVPPVDYEAPTENPVSSERMVYTEKISSDVDVSSQDVEEYSRDVEATANGFEESPNVQNEGTHSHKLENSSNVSTREMMGTDKIIEKGTTTTKEPTERENLHNSINGNEAGEEAASDIKRFEENDSDHRQSDSVDEQDNSEVKSRMATQLDSSAGLFAGMTDALWHGYERVAGMLWNTTPEKPVISESIEITTSAPEEGFLDDREKSDKDADSLSMNQSAENVDDNSGEASGIKASLWPSMWEKPDTKEASPQNTPETVPESSESCRVDSGVDGSCTDLRSSVPAMDSYNNMRQLEQDIGDIHKDDNDYLPGSNNTIWFVISTGILVAIFTLGFIYLEKNKFHSSLVAEVNTLKKALQIKSIETISKSDEGVLEQHNFKELHATVTTLQQQLQDSQERCAELEEKVLGLEKELEAATETGLELNKMLGDILSSQQDSDQLVNNMEDLRRQLDTQEAAMKADLATKTSENEKLQVQLDKSLEKNNQLDAEIEKLKEMLNKTVAHQQELQRQNELLQAQLSEEQHHVAKLSQDLHVAQQTLEEVNQALTIKDSEVTVLQDCLKQTRAGEGEEEGIDKFQALLDVGHVRAELKMASLERDALADRLRGEEGARTLLEDHVELITREVDKLRSRYEEAEKEKLEAQTRLQVLSNYFKEKETQLQKELGLQEAMNLQKDGDVVTTFERIRLLQDEVENYKSQVDTLKKEILDQERGLKSQISALEKKAHENWVAARQAERRLEETKQEAGQLRNRLTIVEKNITNTSTPNGDTSLKMAERLASESNGELPMSPPLIDSPLHYRDGMPVSPSLIPPFMLPPPGVPFMPPPAFMPPPPPPMFPGDRRPPPLGRMSSPPPHFSPPPPPSDYSPPYDGRSEDHSPPPYHSPVHFDNLDRYRRRTPPRWDQPLGPRSGFRPLPPNLRTTPREPKGSAVSSGHSSESLEKSSRHSDNNMV